MAESFRLLQISDLHLAASSYFSERGRSYLQRFRPQSLLEMLAQPARLARLNAVARAAYHHRPLDAILITGDLANWGDRRSLLVAHRFVAAEASDGWHDASRLPTLGGSNVPLHLLPGNHDRYSAWGYGGAGGTLFDEVFHSYWSVGQGVASFILKESLGVVMGDLTLKSAFHGTSPGGVWGQGKVYLETIAFMKLETELLRARHPNIAVFWAVHFAPAFEGLPEDLQLIEEERLLSAAREMGIHQLLCGHTHEQRQYEAGKEAPLEVFCVGAALQRVRIPTLFICSRSRWTGVP